MANATTQMNGAKYFVCEQCREYLCQAVEHGYVSKDYALKAYSGGDATDDVARTPVVTERKRLKTHH